MRVFYKATILFLMIWLYSVMNEMIDSDSNNDTSLSFRNKNIDAQQNNKNITGIADINKNKSARSLNTSQRQRWDRNYQPNTTSFEKKGIIRETFRDKKLEPGFIIIGAQKSGTTSLFTYLKKHDQMMPLQTMPFTQEATGIKKKTLRPAVGDKEIRFFGTPRCCDIDKYMAYFPGISDVLKHRPRPAITGEASPNYLFTSAKSSKQIKELFPDIKLIFMLRNPADRAFSHYHHSLITGKKWSNSKSSSTNANDDNLLLTFEEFIDIESGILNECLSQYPDILVSNNADLHSTFMGCNHNKTLEITKTRAQGKILWDLQLMTRGLYTSQILPFIEKFPRENILFIKSEDFYDDAEYTMKRVTNFLGMSMSFNWSSMIDHKFNFGQGGNIKETFHTEQLHDVISESARKKIEKIVWPFNKHLHNLVGFDWKKSETSDL